MNILNKIIKTTIKKQMIFMLALLAIAGGVRQGISNVIPQILVCLTVAIGLDFLIVYLKTRKHFFSTSAVISGLIIALLLEPGQYQI